jgi:hypothetical protein
MAEAIGLVLGVGGLASLFGATVDAFDQIKAAKSFSRDYEILSTRYDIRLATLLQWGAAVGLSGDDAQEMHPRLRNSIVRPLVERALSCIKMLLNDADNLRSKYGLKQVPAEIEDEADSTMLFGTSFSHRRLQAFKGSYIRFQASIKARQNSTSLLRKTQWAISSRGDFRQLLQDLDDLIEDLYKLVPVSLAEQARLIEEDAATLPDDINHLRLVEEALNEEEVSQRVHDNLGRASLQQDSEVPSSLIRVQGQPSPASFLETAMSPAAIASSSAFASIASSTATWMTAVSHHASLLDAQSTAIVELPISGQDEGDEFKLCESAIQLLRGALPEDFFVERPPVYLWKRDHMASVCAQSSCGFYPPHPDSRLQLRDQTLLWILDGFGENPGRAAQDHVESFLDIEPTFLTKSHITQAEADPHEARYICLVCRSLRDGSYIFRGASSLMIHILSHTGSEANGVVLDGPIIFCSEGPQITKGTFDLYFYNFGLEPNSTVASSGFIHGPMPFWLCSRRPPVTFEIQKLAGSQSLGGVSRSTSESALFPIPPETDSTF